MNYPRPILCPVCKFPTLFQSAMYEICTVCWWEDNGRGDYDPAVEAAQARFAAHGHIYHPAHAIAVLARPSAERRAIDDYLRAINYDVKRADVKVWGPLLQAESDARVKASFPKS